MVSESVADLLETAEDLITINQKTHTHTHIDTQWRMQYGNSPSDITYVCYGFKIKKTMYICLSLCLYVCVSIMCNYRVYLTSETITWVIASYTTSLCCLLTLFFLWVWLHVLFLSKLFCYTSSELNFFTYFSFQNLGIQCVRRREVKDAILQRINRGINPFSGESWLFVYPLP